MLKKCVLVCLVVLCVSYSTVLANEWRVNPNIPAGQDNNWYNPLNWSAGHVPTASETVEWRYAGLPNYGLVINGGTVSTLACTSNQWYAGTASFTVTGGAIYNTTGTMGLYNGAADAAHSPCNVTFTINGGSKVNLAGDAQVGRQFTASPAVTGQCTVNVDGAGSVLDQTSGYWWMGWGVDKTEQTTMNIINGGVAHFAGLSFQPDAVAEIYPVIYLGVGSSFTIKTDRRGAVAGYLGSGYLKPYNSIGTIEYSYNAGTDLTTVVCVAPVIPPVPPIVPMTGAVTMFWDDFDSYPEGTMSVGDPIAGMTPPIGTLWSNPGFDPYGAILSNSYGNDGNSMQIDRNPSTGPIWLYTQCMPDVYRTRGFTYRFEHDVYLPSAGGNERSQLTFFVSSETELGWTTGYYSHTFQITDGINPAIDTGVAVPYDQWFHVRIDVYDNNSVWMWVTPNGGSETVIDANRPWVFPVGKKLRGYVGDPAADTPPAYLDNVEALMIDNTPMGYPVIHPIANAITVDGSVNLGTEWAGVKKVASKPVGSKGNFNPVPGAGWWLGLSNNTAVDCYMGYDNSFFYVAMVGNNVTTTGRAQMVFTWEANDLEAVSYSLSQNAAHASSLGNAADLVTSKSVDYLAAVVTDYNDFTLAGGQMAYTVVGGTLKAEFKIPFAWLSEFAGLLALTGQELDLQFNYVEESSTDRRATTNTIGSFIPDTTYYLGKRAALLTGGITFPVAGDFNGDCMVDSIDLAKFVQNWLSTTSWVTDLNSSGSTNLSDFAQLAGNWLYEGQCD